MSAPDIYGLPEIPEVPNVPIFPSREVDRWPYHLQQGARPPSDEGAPDAESDRVELSDAARSFLAARVLFEDIVAGLRERMQTIREPIAEPGGDAASLDDALRRHAEDAPLATAALMVNELQAIARSTFSRVDQVQTEAFERFRSQARGAVGDATRSARDRLARDGQLDESAAGRIDDIAGGVTDGISHLSPH